ncbi:hypothetical protein APA_4697 [Pseudanabaena sp. lw0831]|uniref:hypothetical protein n=1 Tax=Pseudanabaena sp. lw0831 TaxID=1357935 RepID=UPI001915E805|nr:hypothetical protein [Pseudanabaena sp. lw0831]GBO52137.1 hypothetical protein APA_4697 [Pseudanabaena sp. lw0831]
MMYLELQGFDRLNRNYTYLSQEERPLEEIIKLAIISPLLDLAGFYQFSSGFAET